MLGTFLYLTSRSARNRFRARLKRLREPRYAIGSIVGLLYLYYFVFARGFSQRKTASTGSLAQVFGTHAASIMFAGGLALLLFVVVIWLWPGTRRPIEFTRAEVQFFFQAPISRRQLLHYKLLRSQLALMLGTAFATIIFRPSSFVHAWTMFVGVWFVLSAIRLHSIGASFTRQSLVGHGLTGVARQWVPVVVTLAVVGILGVTLASDWTRLTSMRSAGAALAELRSIWSSGAPAVILWPFMAMASLPVSTTTPEFLSALPAVLGILALHYVWVLRADTAFEEAAAAHAEKRAERPLNVAKPRVTKTPTPFSLSLEGRPETAVVWKNLILLGRYISVVVLIRIVMVVGLLAMVIARRGGHGVVELLAMASSGIAGIACLMGPQMVRNDLRQDLALLPVIKTWPIRGADLLRAEMMAPAFVLTAIAWVAVLTAAILLGMSPPSSETRAAILDHRVSYSLAAVLIAPAVILIQLLVQNGLAVLFPAWITLGASRARGVDAMGQRLLMTFGSLLALVVLMVPGLVIGGLTGVAIYFATETIEVIVPSLALAAVVVGECYLVTEWLGRVLDRTDVGAVSPAE